MQEYPEDIIITFDDDTIYRNFIIEQLYKSYIKHPDCVSAMRVITMNILPDGSFAKPLWYLQPENSLGRVSHSFFATGFGGVLYPPHSMHRETFNIEAIKKLCPHTDDTWLKIMEAMEGVKVASASNYKQTQGWQAFNSQQYALCTINVGERRDIVELNAALNYYSGWRDSQGRTLLEVIREN